MRRRNWSLFAFLILLGGFPYLLMEVGEIRDPFAVNTINRYLSPGIDRLFGTDALGRDMLARALYATGLSLKVVVQSLTLSFFLSLIFGGLAGYYYGRWPDRAILWLISLIYTVPFILIVVSLFAVVEPGIERAYLVIGCIGWAAAARLVRAEVMQVRNSPFVLAEKAYGASEWRILLKSVLPMSFMPAMLSLLYFTPELIGTEVGLSFFGLGAQPPIPSLGRLIYDGLSEFYTAWWLTLIPASILLLMTSAIYGISRKVFLFKMRQRLYE